MANKVYQARCGRGRANSHCCRLNFSFPTDKETIPVTYGRCNPNGTGIVKDTYGTYDTFEKETPIKDVTFVWCLAHRSPMRFKPLRASRSDAPCSEDCLKATGDSCKCSCGGMNHGIEAD